MTEEVKKQETSALTAVLLTLFVILIGVGCYAGFKAYSEHSKLIASASTDFKKEIQDYKDLAAGKQIKNAKGEMLPVQPKPTTPAALVSLTDHILILDPKGDTVLYCSDVTHCYGKDNNSLRTAIFQLFTNMASVSRNQQAQLQEQRRQQAMQNVHPDPAPIPGVHPPVPPKAK